MWLKISGVKVMFRIALVMFKHVLGRSEQLAECPSMYETMEKLRKIPAWCMEEEFLVQEVCRFYANLFSILKIRSSRGLVVKAKDLDPASLVHLLLVGSASGQNCASKSPASVGTSVLLSKGVTVTVTICGDACPLSCVSAEAYKLAQCTRPQGWGS